jgi:predicted methyltransferase
MFKAKITDDVKDIINDYIKEGMVAVDLTAGNGYDTLFLAEGVGQAGMVYAFDIQNIAIVNTTTLIEKYQLDGRVKVILDGHENISSYVDEEIDIAMINLGYLPRGNKTIITKPETTLRALENTIALLKKDGIMTILLYYGHEGGLDEKEAVETYLHKLPSKYVDVLSISYNNRGNHTPILKVIRKK